MLDAEIARQLGIVSTSEGKRGRPKGSKNGATTKTKGKWDHLEAANKKKRKPNATTNILNGRPRNDIIIKRK